MKIKMNVHFQGRHEGQEIAPLAENKEYDVPDEVSESLADWLISVGKATVLDKKYYGSQVLKEDSKPELRHDDELAKEVQEVVDFQEPEEIDATPSAVKLAEKKGVDLSLVTGTGTNGRITNSDVQTYLEKEGD